MTVFRVRRLQQSCPELSQLLNVQLGREQSFKNPAVSRNISSKNDERKPQEDESWFVQAFSLICKNCGSTRLSFSSSTEKLKGGSTANVRKIRVNRRFRKHRVRYAKYSSIYEVGCKKCGKQEKVFGELAEDRQRKSKEKRKKLLRKQFLSGVTGSKSSTRPMFLPHGVNDMFLVDKTPKKNNPRGIGKSRGRGRRVGTEKKERMSLVERIVHEQRSARMSEKKQKRKAEKLGAVVSASSSTSAMNQPEDQEKQHQQSENPKSSLHTAFEALNDLSRRR